MPEVIEIAHEEALKPNEAVRIHGLQARPELNGLIGRVVNFEKTKGRYAVEIPGHENKILLKLANLQLQSVEDLAAPPVAPAGIVPSKYTINRGTAAPASAEDDAAGDALDYDSLLAGIDFAVLRDQLLRAGTRPGCAPMPGRLLRKLPTDRSCLVGIVGILQRSSESSPELVQQACDAVSRLCTSGGGGRSASRRAGAAAALVYAARHPPPSRAAAALPTALEELTPAATTTGQQPMPPLPLVDPPEPNTAAPAAAGAPAPQPDPTLVPRAACHALTNLANGDLACKQAVAIADGAATPVGTIRQYKADELVAKICVGGLANIAGGDAACMRRILDANAVPEVVRVLTTFGARWPDLAADSCLQHAACAARAALRATHHAALHGAAGRQLAVLTLCWFAHASAFCASALAATSLGAAPLRAS